MHVLMRMRLMVMIKTLLNTCVTDFLRDASGWNATFLGGGFCKKGKVACIYFKKAMRYSQCFLILSKTDPLSSPQRVTTNRFNVDLRAAGEFRVSL